MTSTSKCWPSSGARKFVSPLDAQQYSYTPDRACATFLLPRVPVLRLRRKQTPGYAAPTPATFPAFTLNYTGFSNDSAVSYAANIQWIVNSTTDTGITVSATTAYQNGASTITLPDITSLSGFLPMPPSGTTVYWFAYVYGGNYQWFAPASSNGNIAWLQNTGTYTQP